MVRLPSNSPWPDLRNQVDLFREAFPGRRSASFFRKLENITKRKLSYADRDLIIKASLRLIRKKNYAKTAEEFRTQLSWENEDRKRLVEILQKIFSLSDELIKNIELLKAMTVGSSKKTSSFLICTSPLMRIWLSHRWNKYCRAFNARQRTPLPNARERGNGDRRLIPH